MKKITIKNIDQLKDGDLIIVDDSEMLQYSGWNNGHIWRFYGIVFEDECDMDGQLCDRNIVMLTKSELYYHAKLVD